MTLLKTANCFGKKSQGRACSGDMLSCCIQDFWTKVILLNFPSQLTDLLHALWWPSDPQAACSSVIEEGHQGIPYQNNF